MIRDFDINQKQCNGECCCKNKAEDSYFIEISKKQQNISDIYYVNYSNMRKKEYSIITKILKTGVEKKANNENANNHISQINENVKKLQELGFDFNTILKKIQAELQK